MHFAAQGERVQRRSEVHLQQLFYCAEDYLLGDMIVLKIISKLNFVNF